MADVVCLRGLACRGSSAKTAARLRFLGASRRLPVALARGRPGRGARAPKRRRGDELSEARSRCEERRGPRPGLRARSDSLQHRVGVADASAENGLARRSPAPTPGREAQRASTADVCGGAFASDVIRPFSDRAARAPHAPGGAAELVRRQGVDAASVSEWRRCPGGPRGRRGAKRSASCQPAPAQWPLGWGRDTARARGRSEEGPLARAVSSARPLPRPARRSRSGAPPLHGSADAVRCPGRAPTEP